MSNRWAGGPRAAVARVALVLALVASALPAPSVLATDALPSVAAAEPAAEPAVASIAYVPVLRFWASSVDISTADLVAAIEGRHRRFRRVLVSGPDPTSLWAALAVTPGSSTRTASYEEVVRAVERSRRVLGIVSAGEVTTTVRAIRVDGRSLFGRDRVRDLADWPVRTPVVAAPDAEADAAVFDPARTWTLMAGGDVMLDREVYRKTMLQGRGVDYPWAGGYARITSRTCCTADGGPRITTRRVGPRGALRQLLASADITMVNHEGPTPDKHSYHPSGFTFTFAPPQLRGLVNAGIDVVSLANNHIRNAESRGVMQTIRNLRRAGLRSFGAGADADTARRPLCLEPQGVRVCFLGYSAINAVRHAATSDRPGAAELKGRAVRKDIRRLRRQGADVVIVVPHWGTEYVTSVTAQQRRWARAMAGAGADAVLGAHSHVVGAVEDIDGAPVLYSMGDLLFDLPRFEATEEGVLAELTFDGARLAQVELHPTVIVGRSQVMLLDPAADGSVVLERMRRASARLD